MLTIVVMGLISISICTYLIVDYHSCISRVVHKVLHTHLRTNALLWSKMEIKQLKSAVTIPLNISQLLPFQEFQMRHYVLL